MKRVMLVGSVAALLSACAGDQGPQPQDATAAEHQPMAEHGQQAAETHEDARKQAAGAHASGAGPGWTSSTSASERELAAQHRAATPALAAAEQQACAGLSANDRDTSPFYHREDIATVAFIEEPMGFGKQPGKKTVGARIVFRAVPGMSAEWLQRVVDCHLARAAAAGHDMPEMDYCPLVPKDVEAKVTSTGTGFAVDVTSDDPATVKEIIRRAQMLR